jgi:hypothetical protein
MSDAESLKKELDEAKAKIAALEKENAELKAQVAAKPAEKAGKTDGAPKKAAPKKAAPAKKDPAAGGKAAPKKEEKKISPVKLGKKPPVRKGKGAPEKVSTKGKFEHVATATGKDSSDPNLQEAAKARAGFSRLTLHELAILATPPPAVTDVSKALGCALGIPVETWAEGKAIIKDPKLFGVLEKFDYDANECKGLDKSVSGFDIAAIAKTSKAAAAMAEWLVAVSKYKKSKSQSATPAQPAS